MKFFKLLCLKAATFCLLFLAACEHTYQERITTAPPPGFQLQPSSSIYVAVPLVTPPKVDHEAGNRVAAILRDSFAENSRAVMLGKKAESLADSLVTAQAHKYQFVLYPEVLRWVDRQTEWSGRRDQVQVRLTLYRAADGQLLDSRLVEGKSRWLNDGGDQPQDILYDPIEKYVASFYKPVYESSALPPLAPK